jgi:hypothetical protein
VRLMQVSSKTGALAGSGGGVITQAFRPGTEPTSEKRSRAGGGGNKKPATAAGQARKTLKGLY